jgi:hypothetical protein
MSINTRVTNDIDGDWFPVFPCLSCPGMGLSRDVALVPCGSPMNGFAHYDFTTSARSPATCAFA